MAKKDKKTEIKDKESSSSELIQKFKANPLLYIGSVLVLILITVTFVGGNVLFGSKEADMANVFGYYDKAPIAWVPGNTFASNYEQVLRYFQSQNVDMNSYGSSAQVWRQAFEMTVAHTAILQIMKRSNYSIPEKTVDREVAKLPYFQENGRFSAVLYNQMPESSRLSLWKQVHDELIKSKFVNDFYYGLLVPKAEADFIGKMSSVMRTFDMVSFSVDNYPETEYQNYAQANASLFQTIHLSKITIYSGEKEAVKIRDSVRDGTITFEDAARTQSQDGYADRGGDMGIRYYYEVEMEIFEASDRVVLFSLSAGEISHILNIGESWVFYRVEEQLKQADFTDEMTMERVRAYLRNFDRGKMEDWAIAQARDFISEAEELGFKNAALWRYMDVKTFGPLPLNYGGVDLFTSLESLEISGLSSQDLSSLSRNENFWKTAFSTKLNVPSEPLVQGNNVLVLLPVEQVDDEDTWMNISSIYSSYWLNYVTERSLQYYFLNDSRMDDRFWDVFFRSFM